MNKLALFFIPVILLFSSQILFADNTASDQAKTNPPRIMEPGRPGSGPMAPGMMGGGMMPMMKHGMMMKMMERQVVATSDGGVVIIVGDKMSKYDSNLSLVKEAEINIDTDSMMKKMSE